MERKGKNYYRDALKANIGSAYKVLPEVLKKYGKARKISPRKTEYTIRVSDTEDLYNRGTSYWIRGFEMVGGKLYILVYWQSDSTDGDEYLDMPKDIHSNTYIEPTKPVNMGTYYYTARQGLTLRPDDIWEAIKTIKI